MHFIRVIIKVYEENEDGFDIHIDLRRNFVWRRRRAFLDGNAPSFTKLTPNIDVLYEDNNILLADKRQGVLVHEDENESKNTLINNIKAYLYSKGEYDPENENSFVPALCNRIDRNTGGIVIAAKNAEALRILNEKIRDREIKKFYLCLVQGKLREKQKTMKAFLVKNEKQKRPLKGM